MAYILFSESQAGRRGARMATSPTANCWRSPAYGVPTGASWSWSRRGGLADLLVVDGSPIANIRLIEDPECNLRVIMKDGRIYKNGLQ